MDYQVAIPSYKRPQIVRDASVATLERFGVPRDNITVFVANDSERIEYEAALPGYNIVTAELGKVNAQRFYHRYYDQGTPLLNLDDDVYDIKQASPEKKLVPYGGTVADIADLGFRLCRDNAAQLWGINPVNNAFFMGQHATVGLRLICGNFYGNYAGDVAITGADRPVAVSSGDDWETTIRSFIRNGAVVRLEWLTPITKYFAAGGIDAEVKEKGIPDRQVENTRELRAIVERYPDLASGKVKAQGVYSIRLKPITFSKIPREALSPYPQ